MCVGERESETSGSAFRLSLSESLLFRTPVLEPDFDLGLGELEVLCKLRPLGNRQVLLLAKLPLEGYELRAGEGSSGLSILLLFLESRRAWPMYVSTLSGTCRMI